MMTNPETKTCQNCKSQFVIEPEDFDFYKKIDVPPPTWCPPCRAQRRLAFRDYRVFYKRKCDWSGEDIFSIFSSTSPFKVYKRDIWWSDVWDPKKYGRGYDFSKPFFTQLKELSLAVPQPSQTAWNLVRSDYCTSANNLKDCHLVYIATSCEDCLYASDVNQVKNSVDMSHGDSSQYCYDSFSLTKCYQTFFSSHCDDCVDVWFSKNLQGCSNCIGCINLRNKSYHIFNQPYSKEQYKEKIKEMNLGSASAISAMRETTRAFFATQIVKFMHGRRNMNPSGEYIFNSKNVRDGYFVIGGEDCKYIQHIMTPTAKDSYDVSHWGERIELVYETSSCGEDSSRVKFSYRTYRGSHDCEYCMMCPSSSYLFGCVGMQKAQYCILNKQYTKGEYEALVPKIKEHINAVPYADKRGLVYRYGEFLPPELCPFAYNESLARAHFPLTKEEALARGYMWKDREERKYAPTVQAENLPDDIKDVQDSITEELIACSHGGKCGDWCTVAYKIVPRELQFYRHLGVPLPRLCPNCRHDERMKEKRPMRLWRRACQCAGSTSSPQAGAKSLNGAYKNAAQHQHGENPCPNKFETSYSPEKPEIVYCEQCYNAEVA